jgi:hypothetical protein
VLCFALNAAAAMPAKPNIVVILADDLGFGDVRCYNDRAKVATPNLDRLAREGMRFIRPLLWHGLLSRDRRALRVHRRRPRAGSANVPDRQDAAAQASLRQ